jgi:hypothetical protein
MDKKVKPIELTPVPKMTKKSLANETPLKLKMTFEDAISKLIKTPVKNRGAKVVVKNDK